MEFLDRAVAAEFLRPQHRAVGIVERDGEALLRRFAEYAPPRVEKWIPREE